MQRLALFPLGTVLVPGLVMPLTVFEPRYRALVGDLLARPERERVFGVVAIKAGHEVGDGAAQALHEVGTTAVLRQVTEKPDGTFALVTSGAVRFRLHGLDDEAGTPYLTGLVSTLEDHEGDDVDVSRLADRVAAAYSGYREDLGLEPPDLPSSPRVLSYLVAAGMVLDVAERQLLLEQPDTARRLLLEARLLRRERRLIGTLRALPQQGTWDPASLS
jgi:Lon protease-like protein